MRYNVTLDDSMGDILKRIAERESNSLSQVTEVDLIRKAVNDHYSTPWSKPLDTKEFVTLKVKNLSGKVLSTNNEYILFCFDYDKMKTVVASPPVFSNQITLSKEVYNQIGSNFLHFDKDNFSTDWGDGEYFSVTKQAGFSDSFVLCYFPLGIYGNAVVVTRKTFEKPEGRITAIVDGHFLNNFFEMVN